MIPKSFILNRIASSTYPQWISHAEDGCSSSKCFKGYYADVFHALQTELNFTYTITFNKVFGAKQKDGSWSGKIGDFITLDLLSRKNISGAGKEFLQ